MINLKQKELHDWQQKNFPTDGLLSLSKEELVKIILTLQVTLGICEEAGEVAHNVLKGTQTIRGGIKGINKKEVANGVGDNLIFGMQLLSLLNMDVEVEVEEVIEEVLARNWQKYPENGSKKVAFIDKSCKCGITEVYILDRKMICSNCNLQK